MAQRVFWPGGGGIPTRSDEKMSNENVRFWHGSEKAMKSFKKMMKQSAKKKRRQRDKDYLE